MERGRAKIITRYVTLPDYSSPAYKHYRLFSAHCQSASNAALACLYIRALASKKEDYLSSATSAIHDRKIWLALFKSLEKIKVLSDDHRRILHSLWIVHGWSIRSEIMDDDYVCKTLRKLLPSFIGTGMTVYRGQSAAEFRAGSTGISWSSSLKAAEVFMKRSRVICGNGLILRAIAPIDSIISGPNSHSAHLREAEYTIDPRYLIDLSVVDES